MTGNLYKPGQEGVMTDRAEGVADVLTGPWAPVPIPETWEPTESEESAEEPPTRDEEIIADDLLGAMGLEEGQRFPIRPLTFRIRDIVPLEQRDELYRVGSEVAWREARRVRLHEETQRHLDRAWKNLDLIEAML